MKKRLWVLMIALCVPGIIWPTQESWYDWSKRQATQYRPYVPGAITGLSGASLLALKKMYGNEIVDLNDAFDSMVSPLLLKTIKLNPSLMTHPVYSNMLSDASKEIRRLRLANLRSYLIGYAPHLLGTSAALLAAPYLYNKYREYQRPRVAQEVIQTVQRTQNKPQNRFWKDRFWKMPIMQTLDLDQGIYWLLQDYEKLALKRGQDIATINQRIQYIRAPLRELLLKAKDRRGGLTDEQIEDSLHQLFWPEG